MRRLQAGNKITCGCKACESPTGQESGGESIRSGTGDCTCGGAKARTKKIYGKAKSDCRFTHTCINPNI